jgi:hypothetical protein
MSNLTAAQMSQLASDYQQLATQLNQYKMNNLGSLTSAQTQQLTGFINQILHNSSQIQALSTIQSAQDLSPQLAILKQSTTALNGALSTIATVQKVIDIASTVVDLGTAVVSGNINGIISNISTLAGDVGA